MPFSLPTLRLRSNTARRPAPDNQKHQGTYRAPSDEPVARRKPSPSTLLAHLEKMPEDILHDVTSALDDRSLIAMTQAASFRDIPPLRTALATQCKARYFLEAPDARRDQATAHPAWVPRSPWHNPADCMHLFARKLQMQERITHVYESNDNRYSCLAHRPLNRQECALALAFEEMADAFMPCSLYSLPSAVNDADSHLVQPSPTARSQRAARAFLLLALSGQTLRTSYPGHLLTGMALAWEQKPNQALPYLVQGYALGETHAFGRHHRGEMANSVAMGRLRGDEQALYMLCKAAYVTDSMVLYDAFYERVMARPNTPQVIYFVTYGLQSADLVPLVLGGQIDLLRAVLARFTHRLNACELAQVMRQITLPARDQPRGQQKAVQACRGLLAEAWRKMSADARHTALHSLN